MVPRRVLLLAGYAHSPVTLLVFGPLPTKWLSIGLILVRAALQEQLLPQPPLQLLQSPQLAPQPQHLPFRGMECARQGLKQPLRVGDGSATAAAAFTAAATATATAAVPLLDETNAQTKWGGLLGNAVE